MKNSIKLAFLFCAFAFIASVGIAQHSLTGWVQEVIRNAQGLLVPVVVSSPNPDTTANGHATVVPYLERTSNTPIPDPNIYTNWTQSGVSNATVTIAGDGLSVTFDSTGANSTAQLSYTFGKLIGDADLSVCMEVLAITGSGQATLAVTGPFTGSNYLTPTQVGKYCTVLGVTSPTNSFSVEIGMGLDSPDSSLTSITIGNVTASLTFDGLPNELVDVLPVDQAGFYSSTGWNGAGFSFDRSQIVVGAGGLTTFPTKTVEPVRASVITTADSYMGQLWSQNLGENLASGVSVSPRFSLIDTSEPGEPLSAGGSAYLEPLYQGTKDNINSSAHPGILLISRGVNDFALNDNTAAQVRASLDDAINWARGKGMAIVVNTISPFRDCGAGCTWDANKQVEVDDYNNQVVQLAAANADIRVVRYDLLLDVDGDNRIDETGDAGVTTDLNADRIHPNDAGYKVLAEAIITEIHALMDIAEAQTATVPDVSGFSLVSAADYDEVISQITEGSTLDLFGAPPSFNFVVDFSANPGSVKVDLVCNSVSVTDRYENTAIYTVAPQGAGEYTTATFPTGSCTLTATPYELADLNGEQGNTSTVTFNVVDNEPQGVAPTMPADAALNVNENTTTIGTFAATAGTSPITYTISGTDSALLSINSTTGFVNFNNFPDFEAPADSGANNVYNFTVTATNATGTDSQNVAVTIVDVTEGVSSTDVTANITASRTSCASPCTVVMSAEDTTAVGLTENGVWSQLSYHWDFDTDETDTYGALYEQTYTNADAASYGDLTVPGDTAREVGHVPMVTKTFLCATGTCTYTVGLRAQNAAGAFDDEFITITVEAETTRWSAANTICVSNVLSTTSDWTVYDKPCPAGATKQNTIPDADQFENKLVLLRKGETWTGHLVTMVGQDNFKIGYFGQNADARPRITGDWYHAASYRNFSNRSNPAANAPWTYAENADVINHGWPVDNTVDGLKLGGVRFGMSFQHAGIHDVDLDQETEQLGGYVNWSRGHLYCYDFPGSNLTGQMNCANVPFPKGVYVSDTRVVSGYGSLTPTTGTHTSGQPSATLNVGSIGCGMVNWSGITNSYFQKAYEHNLRVMGWYRFSIMRNVWAGEHYKSSKQKISTRTCAGGPNWQTWNTWAPSGWDSDAEGGTRADGNRNNGTQNFNTGDYVHKSRYQATIGNRIGVAGNEGLNLGGPKYQTNIGSGTIHVALAEDVLLSQNVYQNDTGADTTDINAPGEYVTCVSETYADTQSCFAGGEATARIEPTPNANPSQPGS